MEPVNESTESYWTSCFRKRFNLLADSEICPSTTESRSSQYLRLLDHEIEFISGLVRSQKAQRNATSPIFRLPPEVLVLIFKECRDSDAVNYVDAHPEQSGWMECSRVCQRWRHIIFENPSLWSDAIVSQGWPQPSASDLSRTDRISLEAGFLPILTSFLRGFRFSSTILKTIELTVTQTARMGDDAVPLGLLLHNFPALEHISLRDCLVRWEPPPLPSRTLKFMKILVDDNGRRDPVKFFNVTDASEFLRSTPSLEILTLACRFPHQRDMRTDKIIELPCLRELHLGEGYDSWWCSYFFGRLKVPSESRPRVRLSFYGNFLGCHYNPIRSHLQRRFHDVDVSSGYLELLDATDPRPALNMCWFSEQCWKVHIRVISSEAPSVEAPIQSDPGTERHTDLLFKCRDVHNEMLVSYEACRSLPLLFVRVLVIERANARLWAILAERFPSITNITCLGEDAIFHRPRNGNTISSIAPVRAFPKLACLELRNISLQVEASAACVEVLKWLRMRKEAGVPVERLVLERPHTCSTWLAAARGFVGRVEVVECDCYGCRNRQRVSVE